MMSPESDIIEFYPQNFETDLNGKKQEWEAVVLIPFIDEKRLLKTLQEHEVELTPEERARNVHGPMYVFTAKDGEKKVYREEIEVPKNKLVLGPSKGALKNVYFVGFPTFKHLKYTSKLKSENVKVFDQPSRGDNMIIVVEGFGGERAEQKSVKVDQNPQNLIGKTVFVGWPHLTEAKVLRVADKDLTTNSDKSTVKTDADQFRRDCSAIRDHHGSRMGIDVGEITVVIHVVAATGDDYRFDAAKKIFRLHKAYSVNSVAYPLQCVVTDVKAYRSNFAAELPLVEAFSPGTPVFMLTNPYYGAFGEVTDAKCAEKSGRVKVLLTVPQEPNFDSVRKLHEKSRGAYMTSYQTAAALGIGDNVFNRITGTVLVISGNKRELSGEATAKINVGLQLKFPKHNEEVAGYTKKDRIWLYSEKVVALVQEYYSKFPAVFEALGRKQGGNDIFFESDLFREATTLPELTKWLATLPHQKAERRQIGSEALEAEVVEAVKAKAGEAGKQPVKKITMQVKPHLLYAPALSKSGNAPDKTADFQLFDRVVVARDSEKVSVGDRGTVVGVSRVKDLNPVRRECVNKEDIYCDVLLDVTKNTVRISVESLVNVSYGESNRELPKEEPKKAVKELTPGVSYSAILQKPEKNFSDMWNALKQENGENPKKNEENSRKSKENSQEKSGKPRGKPQESRKPQENSFAPLKITDDPKIVPSITAPATLPLPPVEWMKKVEDLRVSEPQQVMPPQQILPPQVLPPPMFFQGPPPPQFQQVQANGGMFPGGPGFFNGNNVS
jgi:5'-3' exoribonuclease 1